MVLNGFCVMDGLNEVNSFHIMRVICVGARHWVNAGFNSALKTVQYGSHLV